MDCTGAPRAYMLPPNLRSFRVLVERGGTRYALGRVSVSRSDGSIFLAPIAATGRYTYGEAAFAAGSDSVEFLTETQFVAGEGEGLKMSLHPDGAAHIRTRQGGSRSRQLSSQPLDSLRGAHVASISTGAVDALLAWTKPARGGEAADTDRTIPLRPEDSGVRFAIYVNRVEPTFDADPVVAWVELPRPKCGSPLFIGFAAIPTTVAMGPGAIAIGGWNVGAARSAEVASDFLYVRAS